jgi:hypothetical protein
LILSFARDAIFYLFTWPAFRTRGHQPFFTKQHKASASVAGKTCHSNSINLFRGSSPQQNTCQNQNTLERRGFTPLDLLTLLFVADKPPFTETTKKPQPTGFLKNQG